MGWRILKAGYLIVSNHERDEQYDKLEKVQWVTFLYSFHTKWMKVEARDCKTMSLPQMSLILKPNSVSIEFARAGQEPTFIVCVQSKIVSSITLRYSPEKFDPSLYQSDILEWQTLFKSAINPSVTYAVVLLEEDTEHSAILHVTERNIQLSVAEPAVSSQQGNHDNRGVSRARGANSVISTDIEEVKLTLEDTLLLTLNRYTVALRTSRLIELYQHLMSFVTGRRNAVGDYAIANFDYVNTRRESRERLIAEEEEEEDNVYIPYEDMYGYVVHSPKQSPNTSPLLQKRSQRPYVSAPIPSRPPPQLPDPGRTILPKLAPHLLSKNAPAVAKPEPPPKPKNSKEILSEFEEHLYKSVRKPKSTLSPSSIGIGVPSDTSVDDTSVDEPPDLPPSRPQYMDFETANLSRNLEHSARTTYPNYQQGGLDPNYHPDVEYANVNPRKLSENSVLSDVVRLRTPTRQGVVGGITPATIQEKETPLLVQEDDEMYESLYSMGKVYSELPRSVVPGARGILSHAPPQPPSTRGSPPPLPYQSGASHEATEYNMLTRHPVRAQYAIISKIQLFDKRLLRPVNSKR